MYILLMSVIGLTGGFLGSKAMGAGQLAPAHLQDDTGMMESIKPNLFFI